MSRGHSPLGQEVYNGIIYNIVCKKTVTPLRPNGQYSVLTTAPDYASTRLAVERLLVVRVTYSMRRDGALLIKGIESFRGVQARSVRADARQLGTIHTQSTFPPLQTETEPAQLYTRWASEPPVGSMEIHYN